MGKTYLQQSMPLHSTLTTVNYIRNSHTNIIHETACTVRTASNAATTNSNAVFFLSENVSQINTVHTPLSDNKTQPVHTYFRLDLPECPSIPTVSDWQNFTITTMFSDKS